jgi:hypothetical protein
MIRSADLIRSGVHALLGLTRVRCHHIARARVPSSRRCLGPPTRAPNSVAPILAPFRHSAPAPAQEDSGLVRLCHAKGRHGCASGALAVGRAANHAATAEPATATRRP